MILVVVHYLIPRGYSGIAVFPFVIVKKTFYKENLVFLNHEKIHLRQQLELLVLPFFVWYFIEFLFRLWQHKNRNLAYRNISFEREAYSNENDLYYLKKRPFWCFLKYVKTTNAHH